MTTTDTKPKVQNWNKPAYIVFTIADLGFLIAQDLSQAVTFLALSFVFDPFNIEMAFQKRPLHKRVWLII